MHCCVIWLTCEQLEAILLEGTTVGKSHREFITSQDGNRLRAVTHWINTCSKSLTNFWLMFFFYTPWKHQKTKSSGAFWGNKIKALARKFVKGLYPHNFERALKSMTSVQIGSIHIDGFKNVQKKFKMEPRCHGNQPKSPKRGKKCLHAGENILSWKIVQN